MKSRNCELLAIIPARSGSKRLPGKNIRLLGDQPLIAWTIKAALRSGVFRDVLVSTDDPEIARIAREYGASVPWLRPSELSSDTANSIDVILHAVDNLNMKFEDIVLLQPTSPFRTINTIKKAVGEYLSTDHPSIVSVSAAKTHPELCFRLDHSNRMTRYCSDEILLPIRSQDLPDAFEVNGALYLSSISYLREHMTFLGPDVVGFVMESITECIDIDDDSDWQFASWLAASIPPL
jgi:CMP-N-acetylneuraminic acid synthetase